MAPRAGFEPATHSLEGCCSIHWAIAEQSGVAGRNQTYIKRICNPSHNHSATATLVHRRRIELLLPGWKPGVLTDRRTVPWFRRMDLNHWHKDFQSFALPTELLRIKIILYIKLNHLSSHMAERVRFELTKEFPLCWFSRPVLSTAQPSLLT